MFGSWTVEILVDDQLWTDADIRALLNSTTAITHSNGFLTIATQPPFAHLTLDEEQRSSIAEILPSSILIGDVVQLTSWCQTDQAVSGPESISWCDKDSDVGVTVWATRGFHDVVQAGIDIENP